MNRYLALLLCLFFIAPVTWAASAQKNLYQAAEHGDITALRKALKDGADVDRQDSDGWTALLFAATNGHEQAVLLLLEQGGNPNLYGKKGETPLIGAVITGKLGLVKALVDAGAKPDARMSNGQTALDFAHHTKIASIVDLLQSLTVDKANTNAKDASLQAITVGLRLNISSNRHSLEKICGYAKSVMVDINCYSTIDNTANPALRLEEQESLNTIDYICGKVTDEDIRIISNWLHSSGFSIDKVKDVRNDPLMGPFACAEGATWVAIGLNR